MSPRRRSWPALVGAVATCALLSGCFGSGGSEPTSGHHSRRDSPSTSPTSPTAPTTSTSTSPPPTTAASSALRFSARSNGKHSHSCLLLHPGDDPAEFLYYPVLVEATGPEDLDAVTTVHSAGVTVAGAWVAPAAATPGTGTLPGWPPPKILTSGGSVQWSKRVTAAGATLDPSVGWYNVFLRVQVDPTPGDSTMSGVQLTYHDAGGSHTDTWVDHVTFSMSC